MNLTPSDGFPYYIALAGSSNVKQLFRSETNFNVLSTLSDEQLNYRYALDKWNIKQIIGHMADHERIMMYRTLRFSRKDATSLPGYDQELMVKNSRFHEMSGDDFIEDFRNVRKASISLMDSFPTSNFSERVWLGNSS
jgi:hypothetical protein